MRWAWVLSPSKPTHCACAARPSNLLLESRWTHTGCPHLGTPLRLGFDPYNCLWGGTLPSARVTTLFFNQTMKWITSPHKNLGSWEWWSTVRTRLRRQQFSDSATPLCWGVSWVVRRCSVPWEWRKAVKLSLVYSPPRSDLRCLMHVPC